MFYYLVVSPPLLFCHLLSHPTLLTSLMLSWWLRQLLPLVVGVAGLSVLCPHAHSTHICPFFSLTHSSLVSFTLSPRFLVYWLLTHRLWAILVSRRHFLGLHELLKHPRTVIHVLADVLFLHEQNQSCFLLTQGLYYCASSRRGIPSHFPSSRMVFCWIYPRSISLGEL